MKKTIALGAVLLLIIVYLPAQQVKIRSMNLKNFPEITAVLSIESSMGAPVPLDTSGLKLSEEGKAISGFELLPQDSLSAPIYTAIVLDKSGSMKGEAIDQARQGAAAFAGMMKSGDQSAYIVFDTKVTLVSEFNADKDALAAAISGTETGSDTALLDAVQVALELLKKAPAQAVKIVLVLSDGRDNRSHVKLDELLTASQAGEISLYTIGLGESIDQAMLRAMAEKTSGNYYQAPRPAGLLEIYQRVSKLLHAQLLLKFNTPFEMDSRWHKLAVAIPYMGREITGEREYLSAKESRIPSELLQKMRDAEQQALAGQGRTPGIGEQAKPKTGIDPLILALAGTLALLLIILAFVIRSRRR
jgi:VWFA-related protein